jgi:hypothetical protein
VQRRERVGVSSRRHHCQSQGDTKEHACGCMGERRGDARSGSHRNRGREVVDVDVGPEPLLLDGVVSDQRAKVPLNVPLILAP